MFESFELWLSSDMILQVRMGHVGQRPKVKMLDDLMFGLQTPFFMLSVAIGSMYDIFTYIWLIFMMNVGKYTIHGSYGGIVSNPEIVWMIVSK